MATKDVNPRSPPF